MMSEVNQDKWKAIKLSPKVAKRFWSKVKITDDMDDECWEWTAAPKKSRGGYGEFGIKDGIYSAHRIAYMLAYDEIPEGLHVCHHCDNPSCVRPDHLFVGTAKENTDDCHNKGRHPWALFKNKWLIRQYMGTI